MTDYKLKVATLDRLFGEGNYSACIRECGAILEQGMRQLLREILHSMESLEERQFIDQAERKVGSGKAFGQFHFTQLEGLYREAKIFDLIRRRVQSNLHRTRRIDWKTMIDWRNQAVHGHLEFDEDEAMQALLWTKTFLYECELVKKDTGDVIAEAPRTVKSRKCSSCAEQVQDDWIYCPLCGLRLSLTCRCCKRVLEPDFRICPYCETKVPLCSEHVTEMNDKAQAEYAILCRGAWLDGVINVKERQLLDQIRLEMGLTTEEAEAIELREAPAGVMAYSRFVEGALADGIISEEERVFLDRKAGQLGIDPEVAQNLEEALKAAMLAEIAA